MTQARGASHEAATAASERKLLGGSDWNRSSSLTATDGKTFKIWD